MDEAEYRAKLDYLLCEEGVSYSARSAIIEAKVKDCEDRAYYYGRTVEEEFYREFDGIQRQRERIYLIVAKRQKRHDQY